MRMLSTCFFRRHWRCKRELQSSWVQAKHTWYLGTPCHQSMRRLFTIYQLGNLSSLDHLCVLTSPTSSLSISLMLTLNFKQIVSETLDHNKDPGLSISDLPQNDELIYDKKWTLFWAARLSMATRDQRPTMFIWPSQLSPLVFNSGARCNYNWGWLRCSMGFGRSCGYYH